MIDPPAAEIVKRLFREFAAGESGRNMAAQLNAEGVDTPAEYYFRQTGKRGQDVLSLQPLQYNGGKEACSTHTIDTEVLESVV